MDKSSNRNNQESPRTPKFYEAGNWYTYTVLAITIIGSAFIIFRFDEIYNGFYLPFISSPLEIFAATYRAYFLMLPEMLDLTSGLLILTLDMIRPNRNSLRAPLIAQTALFISYFPVIFTMYLTTRYFNAALGQYWGGLETIDPFSLFLKSVCLLTVNYVVVIAMRSKDLPEKFSGEFYAFVMFATVAIECVDSSSDILAIYLLTEFVAITCYILVGWLKGKPTSTEAALKYFLLGSMSSAFMVFGFALMYGLSGTTNLYEMKVALHQVRLNDPSMTPVLLLSVVFFMVGIGFKLAISPFHMYYPDVLEGSPTAVGTFLSVTPKIATIAVFVRVFLLGLSTVADLWVPLMQICAVLSMTIGNLFALRQTNMKRFLAYSGISHMGYLLLGLCAAGVIAETNSNTAPQSLGYMGMLHYITVYAIMNTGAFLMVSIVEHHTGGCDIDNFRGLIHRAPPSAYTMLVIFLSMAGIPPIAGFAAKFFVLMPTLEASVGLYTLAVIAILNMVVSAYIYLRFIKFMFIDKPTVEERFYPDATYRYAMIPPFAFLLFYLIGGFLVRQLYAYAASSAFLTINVYFGSGPGS
ncbi:MAG: NADH-quinone oxidoreductase subunit N [bacterium]|nr:NADH-quinone oxidoreductase subunit N [bacterium]